MSTELDLVSRRRTMPRLSLYTVPTVIGSYEESDTPSPPSLVNGPLGNFGEVAPGIYRSSFPRATSFDHLSSLGLKSILYVCVFADNIYQAPYNRRLTDHPELSCQKNILPKTSNSWKAAAFNIFKYPSLRIRVLSLSFLLKRWPPRYV